MKYPDDFINKIICGDCITVMKDIPDNSIDTIITDPPYGLEFMGKEWDRLWNVGEGRSKRPKPAISGQEFKDRIGRVSYNATQNVRCRKCGHWKFSGTPCKCEEPDFPNIKAIQAKEMEKWHYIWAKEALRIAKPGATLMAFGGTRTYHRLACAIEDAGWIIKDCIMWLYGSGFPKSLNIGKVMDKYLKTGNASWNGTGDSSNGALGYSKLQHNQGYRPADYSNKHQNKEEITEDLAKKWNGWGTALKPAYEPILVAMKPNDGSYAENALKWGVSGLNIDECRIQFRGKEDYEETVNKNRHGDFNSNGGIRVPTKGIYHGDNRPPINYEPIGRFPANVILDEEAGKMLDEQSGVRPAGTFPPKRGSSAFFGLGDAENRNEFVGQLKDKGGASRFFYVAKASRAERNAGCEGWYEIDNSDKYNGKFPCSKADRFKNNHPTVKPIKLMEYLCILTKTPTGGIILDPFVGSGTTCIAAIKTGRDFIGIEKEPEYVRIAEARINYWKQKNEEQNKQQTLL